MNEGEAGDASRRSIVFDWGTTNLRAYLIDDAEVVDRFAAKLGVKHVAKCDYPDILRRICAPWTRDRGARAVLLAGMVGGNLGWRDVPVIAGPAGASEIAAGFVRADLPDLPPIHIAPGVYCRSQAGLPGMMRGEEVQCLGGLSLRGASSGRLCLPGTHTKWVEVRDGAIAAIATSMTGEMFDLIRAHSVLAGSLSGWSGKIDPAGFQSGLAASDAGLSALQCIFATRVQEVIGDEPDVERRASRLSGMMIGSEVGDLMRSPSFGGEHEVVVVGETALAELYALAINSFGRKAARIDAAQAFVRGASLLLDAAALN